MGFRPGQSTIDQISTVQQTLENCWEYNISVYLAFINFKQSYDSVRREEIYEALQQCTMWYQKFKSKQRRLYFLK